MQVAKRDPFLRGVEIEKTITDVDARPRSR
jgi:hypothetical protein